MKRHRGEMGAMAPTRYGLTYPSSTDPWQKTRVRLAFTMRSLPADFHVIVAFPSVKEGRGQGGGVSPRGSPLESCVVGPGAMERGLGGYPC